MYSVQRFPINKTSVVKLTESIGEDRDRQTLHDFRTVLAEEKIEVLVLDVSGATNVTIKSLREIASEFIRDIASLQQLLIIGVPKEIKEELLKTKGYECCQFFACMEELDPSIRRLIDERASA